MHKRDEGYKKRIGKIKGRIKEIFKGSGISVDMDKKLTWVNFNNGQSNCEFYPVEDTGHFVATYFIDGEERDLNINIYEAPEKFISTVRKILFPKIECPKDYIIIENFDFIHCNLRDEKVRNIDPLKVNIEISEIHILQESISHKEKKSIKKKVKNGVSRIFVKSSGWDVPVSMKSSKDQLLCHLYSNVNNGALVDLKESEESLVFTLIDCCAVGEFCEDFDLSNYAESA